MQRKGGLLDQVPGASVRVARAGRATTSSRRPRRAPCLVLGPPRLPLTRRSSPRAPQCSLSPHPAGGTWMARGDGPSLPAASSSWGEGRGMARRGVAVILGNHSVEGMSTESLAPGSPWCV